jgi:uncharacterized membrane protein YgcG
LSYPRSQVLLGAVPRLPPLVADSCRVLKASEAARLRRRIDSIHSRFPQLVLQVVLHRFPAEHPFALHVFWLFNAAALAGDSRRGRENHALMLVIDPDRAESAIIPGYGLEPFLANDALDHLLELAGPAWASGRWADGVMRVLDGLDSWLETIAIPEKKAALEGEY